MPLEQADDFLQIVNLMKLTIVSKAKAAFTKGLGKARETAEAMEDLEDIIRITIRCSSSNSFKIRHYYVS